jgi:putative NADPH-quinone reductase
MDQGLPSAVGLTCRMSMKILIVQGHPDATARHYCHALADSYAQGARDAGREVRVVDIATLEFPLLRSRAQWEHGPLPAALEQAQQAIAWADHLVFFFPLWLGGMPALLKGFLEQVARPDFAFHPGEGNPFARKALTGRSARLVVTMGMPALVYRWYFRAHSLKALERNILGFVGIAPIRESLVGSVESPDPSAREAWLRKMRALGKQGT